MEPSKLTDIHKNCFIYDDNDSGIRCTTDVKSAGFRSQHEASRWSSHTEKLCYNETVCGWYIYIYIYSYDYNLTLNLISEI